MRAEAHKPRVAILGLLITVALTSGAACSTVANGNPIPQTTGDRPTVSTPSESDSSDSPPPVENPLDPRKFLSNPCLTLDAEQLSDFSIQKPGTPTTTGSVAEDVGPWCDWAAPELSGGISVAFLTNNADGMANVYRKRDSFAYFEPTTIDGYPAVFADYADLRNEGECHIIVGVSDVATFRANETGRLNAEQSCERAKQVAAAALTTMRRGA